MSVEAFKGVLVAFSFCFFCVCVCVCFCLSEFARRTEVSRRFEIYYQTELGASRSITELLTSDSEKHKLRGELTISLNKSPKVI